MARRSPGLVLLAEFGSFGLSLLLATIVWVAAVNQQNPLRAGRFPDSGLSIEVTNASEGLVLVNPLDTRVVLDLRAPTDSWDRLGVSDVRAFVDLAGLGSGLHEVEVQVESADPNVRILRIRPDRVAVRLDEVAEKTVAVQVEVVDPTSVPLGYAMQPPVAVPPTVTVRGPRVQVSRIDRAEATVFLAGAKTTVDEVISLTLRDDVGAVITGPKVEPAQVRARVPIEQRTGYREVSVRAVITGTVAPGFWISSVTVQPSTVTVVGNPEPVSQLSGFIETESIDVTDAQESISRRVNLALPSGVSLLGEQGVSVQVQIMPITGGKTIQAVPQLHGVGPGLSARVSPQSVDVILSGPLNDLQDLTQDQVQVLVDLSEKEQGTYQMVPTIIVPDSLQVQAIVPALLEVTIAVETGMRDVDIPLYVSEVGLGMESLISTRHVTVTLSGPLLALQGLITDTVAVTLSLQGLGPGLHVVTPTISVPPPLEVVAATPAAVEVVLGSRNIRQQLVVRPSWEGLGDGLVIRFEPGMITITVGGPYLSVQQLGPADVQVTVDVHGLAPGTHFLEPRVVLPAGYRLVGTTPSRLRVILWEQSQ